MKRNYIMAAAAAVLMTTGAVGSANAAVLDLDANTGALVYASEITIAAAPAKTALTIAAANQTTQATSGLAVSAGGKAFYRFDLTGGATFKTAPTASVLIAGTDTNTVLVLGGAGSAFVVFETTVLPLKAVLVGSPVIMSQVDVDVTSQAAVGISFSTHGTLGEANAGTNALKTIAAKNKITFATSLDVKTTAVTPAKIDVGSASTKFLAVAGTSTATVNIIANVTADVVATAPLAAGGGSAIYGTAIAAATKIVVNGDFTAAQNLTGVAPNGTYTPANVRIDADGDCTTAGGGDVNATTLTATKATFNTGTTAVAGADICMTVNGVSVIANGSYTVDYTPTATASHTVAAVTGMAGGTLVKNTVSSRVMNIPGSNVSATKVGFIRILNNSTTAGLIFGTLTDTAGTVLLNNVQLSPTALAAGATLVLGDVFANGAAGALEALGAAPWTGRATLLVESETASIAVQTLVNSINTGGNVQTNLSAASSVAQ